MNPHDEESRRAQEDADWLDIVASYGERPEFPEPATEPVAEPANAADDGPTEDPGPVIEEPRELTPPLDSEEEGYVPPEPPPVPRPEGIRAVAWFGMFGVPVLVLISTVLSITLPTALTLLFLAWFVGGFGYLVATMQGPENPGDGWDDGAVV